MDALKLPSIRRRAASVGLAVVLLGCGDVAPVRPVAPQDVTHRYWALQLDHHAITLSTAAPYDTLQLRATAVDAQGIPLDGLSGMVTFRSTTPQVAYVTADGLLHAVKAGAGVQVIAEYAVGNLRHSDVVLVNVTADNPAPQMLASFSIHPVPPAEAKMNVFHLNDLNAFALAPPAIFAYLPQIVSAGLFTRLTARATDAAGHAIPKFAASFTSTDPTVATINRSTGAITAVRPGQVTILATTTVYGITKSDTLSYTILPPALGAVVIKRRATSLGMTAVTFGPSEITIAPGAMMIWLNSSGEPVDVTFDDPTNVVAGTVGCGAGDPGEAGDAPAFGVPLDPDPEAPPSAANCRTRSFPVAGVYPYHSTATGATGRVVVTESISIK